jgi:hypothetical protein
MTAKIDLTDLFDLFGKSVDRPPVAPPVSPEARKWRRIFADNVAAVLRVREISRTEAEIVGFENTVIEFLNATHPDTDPNRCAHCSRPETPGNVLRPIGVGSKHAWLHPECWSPWREQRRAEAIAALAEAGVAAPVPVQQESVRHSEPDYGALYRERIKLAGEDARSEGRGEEVRLRAFEFTVNACCRHHNCSLEDGKRMVMAAIQQSTTKETTDRFDSGLKETQPKETP